jgi:hypothetical protein
MGRGSCSNAATAPICCCDESVETIDAVASANSGSFSYARGRACCQKPAPGFQRSSGHTSNKSSTKGSVATIGFDSRPSVNQPTTAPCRHSGRLTYDTYAHIVSSQNSVLSTSFRSATQATDST